LKKQTRRPASWGFLLCGEFVPRKHTISGAASPATLRVWQKGSKLRA